MLWVRRFPADDPRGVTFTATSVGTGGPPAQRVGVGEVGGTAGICTRELRLGHKASRKRSSQGQEGATTPSRAPSGQRRSRGLPGSGLAIALRSSGCPWWGRAAPCAPAPAALLVHKPPVFGSPPCLFLSAIPHGARQLQSASWVLLRGGKILPAGSEVQSTAGGEWGRGGFTPQLLDLRWDGADPNQLFPQTQPRLHPLLAVLHTEGRVSSPWGWGKAFL